LFAPTYDTLGRLAPNKPIMIAEVGSTENVDSADPTLSKAAWIEDAFSSTLPNVFPKIRAVAWFNWNQGDDNFRWEIDTSAESLEAFGRGIASDYYAENTFTNIQGLRITPTAAQNHFRQ
jgi:hypothetical protein